MIRKLIRAAQWVADHIYIAREFLRPIETDPQKRKEHLDDLRRGRADRG